MVMLPNEAEYYFSGHFKNITMCKNWMDILSLTYSLILKWHYNSEVICSKESYNDLLFCESFYTNRNPYHLYLKWGYIWYFYELCANLTHKIYMEAWHFFNAKK